MVINFKKYIFQKHYLWDLQIKLWILNVHCYPCHNLLHWPPKYPCQLKHFPKYWHCIVSVQISENCHWYQQHWQWFQLLKIACRGKIDVHFNLRFSFFVYECSRTLLNQWDGEKIVLLIGSNNQFRNYES